MTLLPLLAYQVGLPVHLVFDHRLSPVLRDALFQLMALAQTCPEHTTPVLSLKTLENLTGKSARTWRGYLADLQALRAIDWLHHSPKGWFTVRLADWLYIHALQVREVYFRQDLKLQTHSPGKLHLSPRQRQVLMAMAQGLTIKAIAHQLGISPRTVSYHLEAVKSRSGFRSRAELVQHAALSGLCAPSAYSSRQC